MVVWVLGAHVEEAAAADQAQEGEMEAAVAAEQVQEGQMEEWAYQA